MKSFWHDHVMLHSLAHILTNKPVSTQAVFTCSKLTKEIRREGGEATNFKNNQNNWGGSLSLAGWGAGMQVILYLEFQGA